MDLKTLGWDFYKPSLKENLNIDEENIARVAVENRGGYLLYAKSGELEGIIQGKFMRLAKTEAQYPKVGDWVEIKKLPGEQKAIIENILPRISKLSRRRISKDRSEVHKNQEEQIIATNVDLVFIVQSLDNDYSLERLERYVEAVFQGESRPVILLNKCDLASDGEIRKQEILDAYSKIEVMLISAKNGQGLEDVRKLIVTGSTVVFVGSSGVGKSTLVNALLGVDLQKIQETRFDDNKGKHTTTRREMFLLPNGGVLIDTPGMRELAPWKDETDFQKSKAKNKAKTAVRDGRNRRKLIKRAEYNKDK